MTQHEHTIMLAHHLPQTGSRLTAGHQGDAGQTIVDGPQKIGAPIVGMYHKCLLHMQGLLLYRVWKWWIVTETGQISSSPAGKARACRRLPMDQNSAENTATREMTILESASCIARLHVILGGYRNSSPTPNFLSVTAGNRPPRPRNLQPYLDLCGG